MAEKLIKWVSVLTPGDGDPRHGRNGYSNLNCRCDICRAANVAYQRELREVRRRRIVADPSLRPHGVETTYFNWACRCTECCEVHRFRQSERDRRRRRSAAADSP